MFSFAAASFIHLNVYDTLDYIFLYIFNLPGFSKKNNTKKNSFFIFNSKAFFKKIK